MCENYVTSSGVAILFVCVLLRTTEVFAKGDALAEVDGEAITR